MPNQSSKPDQGGNPPHGEKPEKETVIHIDHKQYKVTVSEMTGAELRQLAEPHIGSDFDLYQEVPGPGDDVRIEDSQAVELKNGMHFYSVLRQVNPGAGNEKAA